MTIEERLPIVRDALKLNKSRFSESIGINPSQYTKIENGRLNLTMEHLLELSKVHEVSIDWLISGTGTIFHKKEEYSSTDSYAHVTPGNIVSDEISAYKSKTDLSVNTQSIPLYRIQATAGIVELFRNHDSETPIGNIQIPNIPKCDGAIYVNGDSMYPLLKSGDIIMYKQTQEYLNGVLFFGEMYLIAFDLSGESHVTVKWIHKSEKGDKHLKLVSENKHHEPYDIPKDSITAMALIKASIRANSMN